MRITKTTSNTYDITFYPKSGMEFTAKEFREARKKAGMSTSDFTHCFCCGHKFDDDEKLIVISVHRTGNRFACNSCLEKDIEVQND